MDLFNKGVGRSQRREGGEHRTYMGYVPWVLAPFDPASMCAEVLRQIPWQLESDLAAKMERREHLVLTFYSPEVPKLKGNRKYQRVRRYLITGQMGGRGLS